MLWKVAGETPLPPANTPAAAQSFQTCYTAKYNTALKIEEIWVEPRRTHLTLIFLLISAAEILLSTAAAWHANSLFSLSIMEENFASIITTHPSSSSFSVPSLSRCAVFFTGKPNNLPLCLSLSLPNRWVWPEGRGLPFIQISACSCHLNPSRLD